MLHSQSRMSKRDLNLVEVCYDIADGIKARHPGLLMVVNFSKPCFVKGHRAGRQVPRTLAPSAG